MLVPMKDSVVLEYAKKKEYEFSTAHKSTDNIYLATEYKAKEVYCNQIIQICSHYVEENVDLLLDNNNFEVLEFIY